MSTVVNYMYSVAYQLFSMLIPFITVPYVSRVLGVEGIGINAYAGSILQYFMLFGSLGIGLYATRTIAYVRDDKRNLSRAFWSIFMLQFTLCLVSFALYIIFIFIFIDKYRLIYIILSLNLLAASIDIGWLFVGMEQLKKLVLRSIFFRVLGTICIFIFIKNINDLWKYTAISSLSIILGQLVIWVYAFKIVDKYKITYSDIVKHLKPSLELFVPQLAIQVYLVLNRTLLGLYAGNQEIGLYDSADRVVKMALAVLTATGGVMLPKIANSYFYGDRGKIKYYINTILNFVSYLGIPMVLGLISISDEFVMWFFGSQFEKAATLVIILSPVIFIIAWSNVMGFQYMIPVKKTREFTISVMIGALINLLLNLLLLRSFLSIGAAISTVMAESGVTISQLYMLKKEIKAPGLGKNLLKYMLSASFMYVCILIFRQFMDTSARSTIIQAVLGAFIYISILSLLKSDINSFIFSRLFKKISSLFLKKEARA